MGAICCSTLSTVLQQYVYAMVRRTVKNLLLYSCNMERNDVNINKIICEIWEKGVDWITIEFKLSFLMFASYGDHSLSLTHSVFFFSFNSLRDENKKYLYMHAYYFYGNFHWRCNAYNNVMDSFSPPREDFHEKNMRSMGIFQLRSLFLTFSIYVLCDQTEEMMRREMNKEVDKGRQFS